MSETDDSCELVMTGVPSIVPLKAVQGEDHQKKGAESEKAILRWLRMTTRVRTFYERNSELTRGLLIYKWPFATTTFSFDFGGEFRGEDIDGQCFLAESKGHGTSANLPKEFRKFLGQCYSVAAHSPTPPSHYLWVSYSPHGTGKWESITSTDEVKSAILHSDNIERIFGTDKPEEAKVDHDAVQLIATSIWMVIYSDRLQTLNMEMEHYSLIQSRIAEQAVAL